MISKSLTEFDTAGLARIPPPFRTVTPIESNADNSGIRLELVMAETTAQVR